MAGAGGGARTRTRARPHGAASLLCSAAVLGAALAPAGAAEVDPELNTRYNALVEWLQAGIDAAVFGRKTPSPLRETFKLAMGRFGRSLFAGKDFEEGATVTLLPTSHLIYDRDYSEGLESFQPNQQLAVYLVRQRALGAESPWAEYMALLPDAHPDLPKYWKPLVKEYLKGSAFEEFVEMYHSGVKAEWEGVRATTGVSWEDFQWAHDILMTRGVMWNASWVGDVAPRAQRPNALFPLFDLLPHTTGHNVDYEFDFDLQAMRIYATRPIKKGDELSLAYFEPATDRSNMEILNKWGFALEDAKKMVEIKVPPAESGQEELRFALETTARDGAAGAFLAVLRARADSRAIVLGDLPEGWWAVPDPKNGWLYYWDTAKQASTWTRPGTPEGQSRPSYTPATFWRVEAAALSAARGLFETALAKYPSTLDADLELLKGDISDSRVRFLLLIRRDEQQVIHWWLAMIRRALGGRPGDDERVDPAMAYLDADFAGHGLPRHASDEL